MFLSSNLKTLRKKKEISQEKLAEALSIKRSALGAYEEMRAEPSIELLQRIATFFSISLDELTGKDLSKGILIPSEKLRVLAITIDRENNENVELVPIKASAGYLAGYADPEFIQTLPGLSLPFLESGTWRAFEITGDSMLPVSPGTIVVARFMETPKNIKENHTYIALTAEGLVYKRIAHSKSTPHLTFHSDNPLYHAYEVRVNDIMELWEARYFIGSLFSPFVPPPANKLEDVILELQENVKKLSRQLEKN